MLFDLSHCHCFVLVMRTVFKYFVFVFAFCLIILNFSCCSSQTNYQTVQWNAYILKEFILFFFFVCVLSTIFFLCLFFFVLYSNFRLKCANSYLISNGYTVWCIVAADCRYFDVGYIFYLFSFMFVLRIKISCINNSIIRFPICDVFSCVLYNNIVFFL